MNIWIFQLDPNDLALSDELDSPKLPKAQGFMLPMMMEVCLIELFSESMVIVIELKLAAVKEALCTKFAQAHRISQHERHQVHTRLPAQCAKKARDLIEFRHWIAPAKGRVQ